MSSPAGCLGGDDDRAGWRVVVIDRARGRERAPGAKVPLGREDEMAEIGGSGDIAGAVVVDDVFGRLWREHLVQSSAWMPPGLTPPSWRLDSAGRDRAKIGRPAVEEAAVGAPYVGCIGGIGVSIAENAPSWLPSLKSRKVFMPDR